MIKWRDEFATGVELIDQQHKRLVEIANSAYEILKDELCVDKYDKIVKIIKELEDYAVFHFGDEEAYMKQVGYRKLLSHKVEHHDFIEKVKSFDLREIDAEQEKSLMKILDFVVEWLVKHIVEKDKQIVAG